MGSAKLVLANSKPKWPVCRVVLRTCGLFGTYGCSCALLLGQKPRSQAFLPKREPTPRPGRGVLDQVGLLQEWGLMN